MADPASAETEAPARGTERRRRREPRRPLGLLIKIASFAVALFLFVLAIQLMKEGAKALAPALSDSPLFSNAISTLGAGWLGAYVVLSGSPIAAVALSLYVGGAATELQTFTMLSGSRLAPRSSSCWSGSCTPFATEAATAASRSGWACWRSR